MKRRGIVRNQASQRDISFHLQAFVNAVKVLRGDAHYGRGPAVHQNLLAD
jgi:hypothetical protein